MPDPCPHNRWTMESNNALYTHRCVCLACHAATPWRSRPIDAMRDAQSRKFAEVPGE